MSKYSKIKIAGIIFLISVVGASLLGIFSQTAIAASVTYCSGNSTLNVTVDKYSFNSTGNGTLREVTTQNVTCQQGCSSFMQQCRLSQFDQSMLMLGLIVFFSVVMIVAVYLSRDVLYLDIGIGVLIGIVSFIIGLTDTFSNGYGYVFYGLGFVFLFMSILLIFGRREK